MGPEKLTATEPAFTELVFDEHGSLPDEHMMATYGLTSEEGRQNIEFGQWKGTFAQMVSDERCPVGGMIKNAHASDGFEGTQRTLEGLKMMAPELQISIAPKTSEHYAWANVPEPKKKVTQTQSL